MYEQSNNLLWPNFILFGYELWVCDMVVKYLCESAVKIIRWIKCMQFERTKKLLRLICWHVITFRVNYNLRCMIHLSSSFIIFKSIQVFFFFLNGSLNFWLIEIKQYLIKRNIVFNYFLSLYFSKFIFTFLNDYIHF